MADGGFRPAYNVQIAGEPDSQVIVGVDGAAGVALPTPVDAARLRQAVQGAPVSESEGRCSMATGVFE